jgi:biopolymer transport protein ExbD
MRRLAKAKPQREPTIALINIVFLMLVFFMVAGTLAQPIDASLKLVETRALESVSPPDALVIYPDGRITQRGTDQIDAASYVAGLSDEEKAIVRLVPDRALPAQKLVSLTRELRAAGVQKVVLVTQRGLE